MNCQLSHINHQVNWMVCTICLMLGALCFTSCSDDDITKIPVPVVDEEMELARENHFYLIDITGSSSWRVTDYPDWACPMEEEGEAGVQMSLFVEENDDELDRRDTIVVALANETTLCLPLMQRGTLRDPANADVAGPLTEGDMMVTYGTGFAVDVIAKMEESSMKYNVRNSSPFNFAKLIPALKAAGEHDAYFQEPGYSSRYESVTGNSTSVLANQLSVNAGIDVGIKAFKFSVEAGYSSNSTADQRCMYAIQEIQHIVGSRYMRAGILRYLAETNADVFQRTFTNAVTSLKKNPTDKKAMKKIVESYGTHIVTRGTLGGELKVSMRMTYTDESDASKIHAALGLSSKVVSVNGSFDMSNEEKNIASNTTLSLQSYGGTNTYSIAPGATFEKFQEEVKDPKKMEKWVSSIKDGTSLALIDIETMPIWDLMPTQELRENLRNYVVDDYQKEKYGANFTPNLYEVTGYDVTSTHTGKGCVYLPEIDVQLDFERAIIPGLSENEYSTVVYSGSKGNVSHDRGFFVGSSTRKPCRFSRNSNGDVSVVEEFERLDTKPIETLYVDVTSNVTIAPQSVTDFYTTTNVEWTVDLSTFTDDVIIDKSCVLTGETGREVKIADGVTVTLAGVTMTNSLLCQGNANIILKADTENSITVDDSYKKNALQNGPMGTTLTIGGDGNLCATIKGDGCAAIGGMGGNIIITGGKIKADASTPYGGVGIGAGCIGKVGNITIIGGNIYATGGEYAAGIGSAGNEFDDEAHSICGNIEISGGTIQAVGGGWGAGIGSGGYQATCGNIEISGGTTQAVGGTGGAGIGSGYQGICGNITILKTITRVVATRGYGVSSIGAGLKGTCGTVTIENGANVVQN